MLRLQHNICCQNKPKRIIFPIFFYVLFDRTKSIVTYKHKNDWNWLILTVFSGIDKKDLMLLDDSQSVWRLTHTTSHKKYFTIPPDTERETFHTACMCKCVLIYNKCIFCRFYIIFRINSIFIYIQFCMIPLWSCSTNVHEIVTLVTVH